MARFTGKLLRTALVLIACSGCAADGVWPTARLLPWQRRRPTDPSAITPDSAVASDGSAGKSSAAAAAGTTANGQIAPPSGRAPGQAADPAAMLAVLAQLKGMGAIDQATQDRLFDDLQKTDPALWPQMLEVFRASLAYRQKYVDQPGAEQVAANGPRRDKAPPPIRTAADAAVATDAPARSPAQASSAAPVATDGNNSVAGVQVASAETIAPTVDTLAAGTAAGASGAANSVQTNPQATGQPQPASSANGSAAQPGAEQAAAPAEPRKLDWREHLEAAIAGLESETNEPPVTTAAIGRHAGLRLLYLVDGRRDSALKPIAGIPPTQQDFWSKELFALTTYLDAERTADESRRAAAASVPLREAAAKLGELATLSVRNLAFCTEVHSYGVFKKFPKYEFQAGQEVLLYAEVENFKTVANEKGFHTALKSSYEILDNHGARVDQKEFEITAEDCQNARRDYFIRYFVWMPKRIYGGNYTLQLTIEDTHSQKIGQSSIDFTIHEKDN
jgi:hypothetical protein